MVKAGVRTHPNRRHFLHAKHLSIDDCAAMIGSSNMNIRSFALNIEVSVRIHEPSVVARLRQAKERYFARLQLPSRAEGDRRPLGAQFAQNIARRADTPSDVVIEARRPPLKADPGYNLLPLQPRREFREIV